MKVIPFGVGVALALGLLAAGAASAGGWDHHDRGRGNDRGGGDRRGYAGPPPSVPVGRPLSVDRSCGDFAPCRYARPTYPGYAPGYGPAPRGGGAWRRGDFLPRDYWDMPDLDPHRYRLRTPPPGYAWHGAGRDAYLVQRSTGLILDTVPGVR